LQCSNVQTHLIDCLAVVISHPLRSLATVVLFEMPGCTTAICIALVPAISCIFAGQSLPAAECRWCIFAISCTSFSWSPGRLWWDCSWNRLHGGNIQSINRHGASDDGIYTTVKKSPIRQNGGTNIRSVFFVDLIKLFPLSFNFQLGMGDVELDFLKHNVTQTVTYKNFYYQLLGFYSRTCNSIQLVSNSSKSHDCQYKSVTLCHEPMLYFCT